MTLPKSDELAKQRNNQVQEVCRALFGRAPDLHSPDDSLIQYGNILIHIGGRKGSWFTHIDPKTNTRRQSNSLLELIQFRNQLCEGEALDWARNRGLLDPTRSAPTPPPEPQQDRRRDHAGGDGAKSGNEEKTRYIEQVAEPGKAIVGTNTNPFWKWKSPWYEQVSIQAAQSIHLATVLGIVGHNVTGESEHSYEYLGRFMGRTWRTALNQMKPLIKCGNVEVLNQGGKKGDRKTANLIRPVLKTGQPKALDVLLGKSAKAPKPESTK